MRREAFQGSAKKARRCETDRKAGLSAKTLINLRAAFSATGFVNAQSPVIARHERFRGRYWMCAANAVQAWLRATVVRSPRKFPVLIMQMSLAEACVGRAIGNETRNGRWHCGRLCPHPYGDSYVCSAKPDAAIWRNSANVTIQCIAFRYRLSREWVKRIGIPDRKFSAITRPSIRFQNPKTTLHSLSHPRLGCWFAIKKVPARA